jgi:hypothetical protein
VCSSDLPLGPARWTFVASLAAAAAVLIALVAWWRSATQEPRGREPETLAAILARGAVAASESGRWRALEPSAGVAHAALAGTATYVTPASAALELANESGDRLTVLAESSADLRVDAGVSVALAYGGVRAQRAPGGATWRVEFDCDAAQRHGAIELAAGELELVAGASTGGARAALSSDGAADLLADAQRFALAPGIDRELCADPSLASPSNEDQRARVEPEAVAPSEPAVPALPTLDLVGEVRDAESAALLDDFTVVLAPVLALPKPSSPQITEFNAAGGHFEFAEVVPGDYVVWVGARGYAYFASERLTLGDTPHDVRAALERGVTLGGRVIDRATRQPVEGARVISESDVPAAMTELHLDRKYESWVAIERTDASGRFLCEHLRSAATRLRVTAPGFAPAWAAADGSRADVEIELSPGATLAGRVEDSRGEPQADHLVVAVPLDASQYSLYWSEQMITDEHGEFRAPDLPPIQCVVVHLGSLRDRASWSTAPTVRYTTLAAGETRRVEFTTRALGARIFGRVLDPRGEPVGDRTLTIVPAGAGLEDPTRWRITHVEADGRYAIGGLTKGEYELYLSARTPSEVLLQATVEVAGENDVEFDLHVGSGTLRGRVRAKADGAPIANVVFVLERVREGRGEFAARVFGESDGAFEFPTLADGTYRLLALPQDGVHALATRAGLVVAGGDPVEPVEIELELGARATVRAVGPDGAPFVGAEVVVHDLAGNDVMASGLGRTDADGRIELVGLPAGTLRFVARVDGSTSREAVVDLAVGDAPTITLEFGAR